MRKEPRDYQKEAIEAVVKGFEAADRGQLIMPCGSGKTLVSIWVYEKMNPNHTIVLVPSLALLRQIKNEWLVTLEVEIPYLCVCSDKSIDSSFDEIYLSKEEIGGNVSSDIDEIRIFLNSNKKSIIFCTYQSLDKIIFSLENVDFSFDLAICDEAHRTTGTTQGLFSFIHENNLISISKRLYMTATPRVWKQRLSTKLNKKDNLSVIEMNNFDIFGSEFFYMSFKEAIDRGILSAYKIIVIGINDKDISQLILENKHIDNNTKFDELIHNYALNKFYEKYDPEHIVSFHSTIKKAKSFQERHNLIYPSIKSFHINSEHNSEKREAILREFSREKGSLISNARCLTEGVDLPNIDTIYFCDSKESKIDIMQATGRALRISPKNKNKIAYVVIPLYHKSEEELHLDNSKFINIINVLRALGNHDERIDDSIRNIRTYTTTKTFSLKNLNIEFINFNYELSNINIEEKLFEQVINNYILPWKKFEEAREFVRTLNLKSQKEWIEFCRSDKKIFDIPTSADITYKEKGWISWGDWLGTFRRSCRRLKRNEVLNYEDAKNSIKDLKIKSAWHYRSKYSEIPKNVPLAPHSFYKNDGWIGWYDFLGIEKSKKQYCRNMLSYEEAKSFVKELNIKSVFEWRIACKSGIIPSNIPCGAAHSYKNKGWNGWSEFLGNNNPSPRNNIFTSYNEAELFARGLKLNSYKEWKKISKNRLLPQNIPCSPDKYYENKGWEGWPKFLGCKDRRGKKND